MQFDLKLSWVKGIRGFWGYSPGILERSGIPKRCELVNLYTATRESWWWTFKL